MMNKAQKWEQIALNRHAIMERFKKERDTARTASAAWKAGMRKWREVALDTGYDGIAAEKRADNFYHRYTQVKRGMFEERERWVAAEKKCKVLEAQLEDVGDEWDAERIRYQEQLKRVAELEEALREIEKVGDDAIAYEWWELPMKVSQIIERALNK